jgi:hypothetical protein
MNERDKIVLGACAAVITFLLGMLIRWAIPVPSFFDEVVMGIIVILFIYVVKGMLEAEDEEVYE